MFINKEIEENLTADVHEQLGGARRLVQRQHGTNDG
jgi:hypothetical protein